MDKRAIQKKIRKIIRQQNKIEDMIEDIQTRVQDCFDTNAELIELLTPVDDGDDLEDMDEWLTIDGEDED